MKMRFERGHVLEFDYAKTFCAKYFRGHLAIPPDYYEPFYF